MSAAGGCRGSLATLHVSPGNPWEARGGHEACLLVPQVSTRTCAPPGASIHPPEPERRGPLASILTSHCLTVGSEDYTHPKEAVSSLCAPSNGPGALGTVSHTHRSAFLAILAPPVSQGEVLSGLASLRSTNTHDMGKRLKGTDQLLAASPTTSQAAERPLRALTKAGPCGQPGCVLGSQVMHHGAFDSPGRGPVTECLSSEPQREARLRGQDSGHMGVGCVF